MNESREPCGHKDESPVCVDKNKPHPLFIIVSPAYMYKCTVYVLQGGIMHKYWLTSFLFLRLSHTSAKPTYFFIFRRQGATYFFF